MSQLQNDLRRKGQLIVGDKIMLYAGEWQMLKIGDQYLAHTEGQDPDVLTVRRIEVQKRPHSGSVGKIYPKERGPKLYDLHEVVKITIIDNPNLDKENKPDDTTVTAEPGKLELHAPGPHDEDRPRPEAAEHSVPRPDGPPPGADRPIPRPPGRGGGTDYSGASRSSTKRESEASQRREPVGRDAYRGEQ